MKFLTNGKDQAFYCRDDGKVMMLDMGTNEVTFFKVSTFERVYTELMTPVKRESFIKWLTEIHGKQISLLL